MRAPELDGAEGWVNTPGPLRLADLQGRLVLLYFWSYGRVGCHHLFPDLEMLAAKYGGRLAVIGIHSPRFPAEKAGLRQAVARHGLGHPVADDASLKIWKAYGVTAWPTLVLIGPDGLIAGRDPGEGGVEAMDRAIGRLMEARIAAVPLPAAPFPGHGELRFPGKVAAGGLPVRIYVSDTGHHRILCCDLEGRIQAVYGSGEPGLADGPAAQARFRAPQGLCLSGASLYVADAGNHAIRAVHLKTGTVRTAAGTGRQARWGARGGKPLETDLNSPWDIVLQEGKEARLLIAMAGGHQVWRLEPSHNLIEPWLGNGRENIVDGDAGHCELAQPMGLCLDGDHVVVADSESSGIRAFSLKDGRMRTLVGTGLSDFGDGEGSGGDVLQHPMAVLPDGKELVVADTYNHRLKRLDPATGRVRFWLGDGEPGDADGPRPRFNEPGGLALHYKRLYVADTNNHRIRVVDLETEEVSTLAVAPGKESP